MPTLASRKFLHKKAIAKGAKNSRIVKKGKSLIKGQVRKVKKSEERNESGNEISQIAIQNSQHDDDNLLDSNSNQEDIDNLVDEDQQLINEENSEQIKGEEENDVDDDNEEGDSEENQIEGQQQYKSQVIEKLSDADFENNEDEEDEGEELIEEKVKTKKLKQNGKNDEVMVKEVVNRSHLSKYWQVYLSQPSIYTGGRILIAPNEEFMGSIANFKIALTDLKTKKVDTLISHDEEELCNFAIHPNSKFMATFTRNNVLRFINIETREIIHTWRIGDQWALDMAFDSTGQFLAIACVDGFIKVYDVRKGNLTHNYKVHKGSVTKVLFHPKGSKLHLISVGEDYAIRIYDLVVSTVLKSIVAHTQMVTSVLFSEDGSNLLTAASDSKIIVWDYDTMTKQAEIIFDEQVEALGYLKIKTKQNKKFGQISYLAATGTSGIIKLIDISSNDIQIIPFPELKTHEILKIMTLPKKEQICAVTVEQNVIFYDFVAGPKLVESDVVVGFNDEVTDAKFCKKARKEQQVFDRNSEYIVVSTNSTLLKAVELSNGKTHFIKGHTDFVLTLDTYGPYIISAGKDKTAKLWKKENDSFEFKLLSTFIGHIESVSSVCFAPKSGKVFATGSEDQNVKIWESSSIQNRSHKIIKPENITSSKRTVAAHTKGINVVKFSPNDKLLATASQDKQIKIWDAENLSCKIILKGHKRGVWDVNFSPVEKLLASGSGDNTVKVWNLEDGQCVGTFEGHLGSVLKVSWICFGLEIVSAGADGLLKIWNVKKSTCLNTVNKHQGKIWALDVSTYDNEGKQYLMTGGNDSNLFVWEDVTKEEELKKTEKEHEVLIQQDNFASMIRGKDYINAVKLAFRFNFVQKFHIALEQLFLQRDFKSGLIFSDTEMTVVTDSESEKQQQQQINDLINNLIELDINKLLLYIRDMNTTQKSARVAQRLLNYVIKSIQIDEFVDIAKKFKSNSLNKSKKGKKEQDEKDNKIPSVSDKSEFDQLMDALISYTKRHAERIDRFIKKSYYLDFVLRKIDLLAQSYDDQANNQQILQ